MTERPAVDVDIVVIGAGMSGLAAAVRFSQAGLSFVVLEKGGEVGGTWSANRYPGCACDIPSHLYGYSFAPNPGWSKVWADQDEILAYLKSVVDRFGIRAHIRLRTAASRVVFDETTDTWVSHLDTGETIRSRYIVSATGPLRIPKVPPFPGKDDFAGPTMHSARWDHSIALEGKRVGVVGSAASAVQLVPKIADRTAHLTVFQRTPNYFVPKPNRAYRPIEQWAMANIPGYWRLLRWRQFWTYELRFFTSFTPDRPIARFIEGLTRRYIRMQVPDPTLQAKLLPDYRLGCKRILLDSDYLATLCRDDVTLVTDPIARLDAGGIVTEAGRHDLDVIIFATGFEIYDMSWPARVVGPGGQTMEEAIGDSPRAWLGLMVSGFPNAFSILGPNTGLGHNSVILMSEAQIDHIVRLIQAAEGAGMKRIDVRKDVMEAYNDDLQSRLQRRVWVKGGCASWYQFSDGTIRSLWPDSVVAWQRTLRRVDLSDYVDAR